MTRIPVNPELLNRSVISRHLKNIFDTRELERSAVVAKNATTAADGKTYQVEYYNLDAIISVGYRVNSTRATRFRQHLLARSISRLVNDNTLVALALLVAESKPE